MSVLSGLHHVKLPVSDIARSRAWHLRVLDFEVTVEFVEAGVVMGLALVDRARSASIGLRHDPVRAAAVSGFDAVALAVPTREGVESWRARLDELGEPHGGIVTGHKGGSVLVGLHDPDGIEIRLYAE